MLFLRILPPRVVIHTDGSCNETLTGGYAAIVRTGVDEFIVTGGKKNTTNNRMELLAVISAIEQLQCSADVLIYSDSQYVVSGIAHVHCWKDNGWVSRSYKPVKNRDLWERYLSVAKRHQIKAIWQKSHNGEAYNELCDKLAKQARDTLIESDIDEFNSPPHGFDGVTDDQDNVKKVLQQNLTLIMKEVSGESAA